MSKATINPSALALKYARSEAYAICNGEPRGTNGPDDPGGVLGRYQKMIESMLAVSFDEEVRPILADNAAMAEALRFYANHDNWRWTSDPTGETGPAAQHDMGDIAIAALDRHERKL